MLTVSRTKTGHCGCDHLKKPATQSSLTSSRDLITRCIPQSVFHSNCAELCYKCVSVALLKHLGFFYTSPICYPQDTLKT